MEDDHVQGKLKITVDGLNQLLEELANAGIDCTVTVKTAAFILANRDGMVKSKVCVVATRKIADIH